MTDFAARVHAFVQMVPKGRVTTYSDVALAVGRPGAARAVGRVMAATPARSPTPCHRVVRADGRAADGLAGRLRREGVAVDAAGQVRGFAALRWP
ncbi:MAG: methylated-DNA-[protein]-cysteine S-methyltransferase [Thermoplasmata archaeon]|nr:methylated-DNA-[protein]-cysteine S-methyltransferase [Thermoplasmata archaeon]